MWQRGNKQKKMPVYAPQRRGAVARSTCSGRPCPGAGRHSWAVVGGALVAPLGEQPEGLGRAWLRAGAGLGLGPGPARLGVQEAGQTGTLTLGDLRCPPKTRGCHRKGPERRVPAFPHSQAVPEQPEGEGTAGATVGTTEPGRSGQASSLQPRGEPGRRVGRRVGAACSARTRGQDRDPGGAREAFSPALLQGAGAHERGRPPGTPLGSGRGTGRETQKCEFCAKGSPRQGGGRSSCADSARPAHPGAAEGVCGADVCWGRGHTCAESAV